MCGVAGIFSYTPVSPETIEALTQKLLHRGPDANGIFLNQTNTVALGHTRLSIIDLSQGANQPLTSTDGQYVIVFNGEIYNFHHLRHELLAANPSLKLKTGSDTEIILAGYAQWGSEVCNRLEGMFVFAIYDKNRNEIFIARDRIGKKPLFYFSDNSCFVFASEIKSLIAHPHVRAGLQVNQQAAYNFLHLGYIPEPDTIYSAVKKFPSGSFAVVTENLSCKTERYWKITDHLKKTRQWTVPESIATLKTAITEAVEKRLISDVPLGAFLSGGTDSSLVVAIASRLKQERLKTFTIGFEESKFDERKHAAKIAKHLNTDHHEYVLKESEAVGMLDQYLKHFDEPFADTSAIPTMLVSKLARKEVTVALTGDGGDESFLGYGAYDWARKLQNPALKLFQDPLSKVLYLFGNNRMKRASFLFQRVATPQKRSHIFSQEQYFFTAKEVHHKLAAAAASPFLYNDFDTPGLTEEEKQAVFDIQYYLKDDLLVKVDRASMYYGLECRSPLLDHRVMELAMSLSCEKKIRRGERKWILKQLMKDYFPDELIYRPKWGFSVPLAKWLRNDLSYLIDQYLSADRIQQAGFVKFDYVKKLKSSFFKGDDFLYNRLWVLIVLHKWLYEKH